MTDHYRLILACYLSGQMSEAQWQAHKAEPLFALWLKHITAKTPKVGATRK